MPKAELVVHRRVVEPDGTVVTIKIWRVPKNPRQPHGFKYSLVCIVNGERVLGYDNAHGQDHRHFRKQSERYQFVSPEVLIEDFLHDLGVIREKQT